MSIWGTLFNSGNTLSKVTDAVINTGDKLVLTDEERLDYKQKYMLFMPTLLKSYEPFKIAQRILAIWFSLLFGIAFISGLAMTLMNVYLKYQALKLGKKASEIILLDIEPLLNLCIAFSLPTIIMIIMTWYFGGGLIESFKKKQ